MRRPGAELDEDAEKPPAEAAPATTTGAADGRVGESLEDLRPTNFCMLLVKDMEAEVPDRPAVDVETKDLGESTAQLSPLSP